MRSVLDDQARCENSLRRELSMTRSLWVPAIGSILIALSYRAEAQGPVSAPTQQFVSFSRGSTYQPARRPPPLRTVDPTSRDGASLRSRTRPNVYFQSPGLPYGLIPIGTFVPTILPVMGSSPVIYSRAYAGAGPIQYGGTYNLYGGYATANVPEGRPTVIVIPPPADVLLRRGR